MFGLLKKLKKQEEVEPFMVTAPVTGTIIDLSKVNDPVFAQKMMGDGFAVKPDTDSGKIIVSAPVSGKVVSLPDTKHAVGIHTPNGVDVLVHIGIDTVNLKGEGFSTKIKEGDEVKHGEKLIEVYPQILEDNKLDNTIIVIFTGGLDKPVVLNVNYNSKVDTDQKLMEWGNINESYEENQ